MPFDPLYYPYASRRSVVYARKGMVATSQPLAAQAGLRILQQGGNAVDAAIATAACLTVVEPTCNGLGGDAFAQVWDGATLHGLNSSGPSPRLLTLEKVRAQGHTTMPHLGVLPITVGGIPAAWAALSARFGRLPLTQVLEPAITYAAEGFPLSPVVADLWAHAYANFVACGAPWLRNWFDTFAPQGRAPFAGEMWSLPAQAATLQSIAETQAKAFYSGHLAEAIDALMREHGGYLRAEDLADFSPTWVDPLHVSYRGYDIWEIPPNGHGIVALMALNILRECDLSHRDDPQSIHTMIEAIKLAFADGLAHVADPSAMRVRPYALLAPAYAAERRALIGNEALMPCCGQPPDGGTVYLATADDSGMMVSYIQSNYLEFGSGLVVANTGIALQNRGACFSMEDGHPNVIAGGKKPYHTIIPGFITKNSQAIGPFGMMGGFIQPQGHVMLASRLLDNALNP
ncbi:MAG: gamma-glutamyltransferase family protein, partial [Desulfovibrionaceae bacterium]